jgi:hypothetical protein
MMIPESSSELLRQEKWWAAWRKVDFSWAALAKHSIARDDGSSQEKTLQEFWRSRPNKDVALSDNDLIAIGELERSPTGDLWHIAHVPIAWNDGTPTWKSDARHTKWQRFWEVLKDRVFPIQKNVSTLVTETEASDEAQFAGVVFGRTPPDWQWHDPLGSLNIKFATCVFLGEVDISVNSRNGLSLRSCLFCQQTDFDYMSVDGDVDLSDSTFLANVSLCHAEIGGNFSGNRMHCFREVAILDNTIKGTTEILQSVFCGPIGFESTKFKGQFNATYCRFLNLVSMAHSEFGHDTKFVSCIFSAEDITFTGKCEGDFYLIDCILESSVFAFIQFCKAAYFSASHFRQSATFQNVHFYGKVSFRNSIFEAVATFQKVWFHDLIEFHNTVFAGVADLSECTFPKEAPLFHSAFRGAEFRRVADFTNPAFHEWGAFSQTKFHQAVLFSPSVLRSDTSFNAALAAATSPRDEVDSPNAKDGRSDRRFAELEAAFQCLKVAMASQQARSEEQRFYRYELIARRRQTTTPFLERVFSIFYEWTSACGTSIFKPVVWLVSITAVFAFIYWAVSHSPHEAMAALWPLPLRPLDPDVISALSFSVRNVIQPFAVWNPAPAADNMTDQWLKAFLHTGGGSYVLIIRLIATLQSLVSTILLFLSGLAAKRRFQVT